MNPTNLIKIDLTPDLWNDEAGVEYVSAKSLERHLERAPDVLKSLNGTLHLYVFEDEAQESSYRTEDVVLFLLKYKKGDHLFILPKKLS